MTSHTHRTRNQWQLPALGSRQRAANFERLVREGVERFMLKRATIDEFRNMLRSAARSGAHAPHPLTRAVFSKIVKEAVRKRNAGKPGEGHTHMRRKTSHAKTAYRRH